MIPDTDERLASVVRALTDVVLPALPPEAGLAMEQVQLSIGQLQILRSQLDSILSYEADELADATALGSELRGLAGDDAGRALDDALAGAKTAATPGEVRDARKAIHAAIDMVVTTMSRRPEADRRRLQTTIIAAERKRVVKDRRWYAPFGFDIAPPTEA